MDDGTPRELREQEAREYAARAELVKASLETVDFISNIKGFLAESAVPQCKLLKEEAAEMRAQLTFVKDASRVEVKDAKIAEEKVEEEEDLT